METKIPQASDKYLKLLQQAQSELSSDLAASSALLDPSSKLSFHTPLPLSSNAHCAKKEKHSDIQNKSCCVSRTT